MDRTCRPGGDLLSQVLGLSTIGAGGLNGRVRNGNGWGPPAITTRSARAIQINLKRQNLTEAHGRANETIAVHEHREIKPIEQLVPVSFTYHYASTPGLSTWSSSTALKGNLVLRWASCLDAFSSYPFHT